MSLLGRDRYDDIDSLWMHRHTHTDRQTDRHTDLAVELTSPLAGSTKKLILRADPPAPEGVHKMFPESVHGPRRHPWMPPGDTWMLDAF